MGKILSKSHIGREGKQILFTIAKFLGGERGEISDQQYFYKKQTFLKSTSNKGKLKNMSAYQFNVIIYTNIEIYLKT